MTTDGRGSVTPSVRAFNRGWTQVLGLLDHGLLDTLHSLPESRVIFELAQRDSWARADLRERLGIDNSFLTRLLAGLEASGLISIMTSTADARRRHIALTAAGRRAFTDLDDRSSAQIEHLFGELTQVQRRSLVDSMATISALVPAGLAATSTMRVVLVRGLEPGDLGWVVRRHGEIYADEFGWDQDFEGLVATIVGEYQSSRNVSRTNAWIAEVDGARAGCIFCCERDAHTAQLRILLVEPSARGLGVGARLVDECIGFARRAGYRSLALWTNDVLIAARRIYQTAGFRLVDEEPHRSFGHDLVGQTWTLDL